MDISFIVPIYNQLECSRAMLMSLLKSVPLGYDYEVLLIDDGSEAATRRWLDSLRQSRVKVLYNATNLGYARTNNKAVANAKGRLIALLNNDVLLSQDWLLPMLSILENRNLNAGIVGNIQYRFNSAEIDHAGVEVTAQGKIEHLRAMASSADRYPAFAVTAACCLLRRTDFLAVGGFDECYVNGGEDVDLCLKLKARGLSCEVSTQSRIHHHVSLTRGVVSTRDERNSMILFTRWRDVIMAELMPVIAAEVVNGNTAIDGGILRFCQEYSLGTRLVPPKYIEHRARAIMDEEFLRWSRMFDKD
jgi:GT2 family glycosyltransferase